MWPNSFTNQRSSKTRGMHVWLHGDEVCPVFEEQTMVPFQHSEKGGKQDIMYVAVHGEPRPQFGQEGNKRL